MTKSKTTRHALLMSALALIMCVSMLAGSTFAWFTDTATTGVNTIQSGTLDVILEYKDATGAWVDAEGETLNFVAADGRDDILWEPGCTYELPAIRVRNNGNLALKYEIVVNGVNGNAKLLEAIDFTVDGAALSTVTGDLKPADTNSTDDESAEIVIVGTMKTTAGNQYQDLSLYGIGITVRATQFTYEQDSNGDQYDVNAPNATQAQTNKLAKTLSEAAAGDTIYLDAVNYGLLHLGSGAYPYDYPANLTLVGQEGTVFTGISISDEVIAGWTFKDITFIGNPTDNAGNADGVSFTTAATVSNLTFDNCTFTNGAKISMIKTSGTPYENVTVKNCTFSDTGDSTAILLQGVTGITVTDNTFTNIGYNALQTNKSKGEVIVSGNKITSTGSRAMRIAASDANIKIDNNTMTDTDNQYDETPEDRGQIIKVSGGYVLVSTTGNTHNGNDIQFVNGIATEVSN